MIGRLRALAAFLYDFVIGDDPQIAVVVAVALGTTAVLAGGDVPAWSILPIAVVAVLSFSLHRATRPRAISNMPEEANRVKPET